MFLTAPNSGANQRLSIRDFLSLCRRWNDLILIEILNLYGFDLIITVNE